MRQLWAPWRMAYIEGQDEAARQGCIFCVKHLPEQDNERMILWRGEHALVMVNKYPYTNGHLMVAPYRHTASLAELDDVEVVEIYRLLSLAQSVLEEVMQPHGFNIGMNLGRVAGAGVEDHLHLHIVPRWNGDTNFMPVFADVRVIPQHLQATYQQLASAFARRQP